MKIRLPLATPSQNEYQRAYWRRQHELQGTMRMLIRNSIRKQGIKEIHGGRKVKLVITRGSSGTLDYGNLVGGCKPLLDALKREGAIVDDSPQWVEDEYHQVKTCRGESWMEIEIEPID